MENRFDIDDTNGFVIKFKKEANLLLASYHDESKARDAYNQLKNTLHIINAIGELLEGESFAEEIEGAIAITRKFWHLGLLSPLTLYDDEFEQIPVYGICRNKRYGHIYKKEDIIYNDNAFNVAIRAAYDHDYNVQYIENPYVVQGNVKVFISKGGIITGEYIDECVIPQKLINKHCFTIQSVVSIPVSTIKFKNEIYYVVDHREPKLKVLRQFYSVPVKTDEEVKSFKFNIRKYKKL